MRNHGRWAAAGRCALLAAAAFAVAAPAGAQEEEQSVIAPLASRSLLLDVTRAGARLVSVGERGHVLLSDDQGRRWRQVQAPTRRLLTAVHFPDPRTGYAVGHDAVILRTRDAGETWERVHAAPEEELPLLTVWFADAGNGIAMGAYAYMLATGDGGDTWEPLTLNDNDDFHLNRLAVPASGELLVAAEAGFLYRRRGGGWETLDSPYEGSFFGALARADDYLVFGLRGNAFRSVDAGENWVQLDLDTEAMLTDATRLPDGREVIVGLDGVLLIGAGDEFTRYQLPSREGLSAVLAVDANTLVVSGEAGVRRLVIADLPPAAEGAP